MDTPVPFSEGVASGLFYLLARVAAKNISPFNLPFNFIYLPGIRDTGIAISLLCLVLRLFAASLVVCVALYWLGGYEGRMRRGIGLCGIVLFCLFGLGGRFIWR